MKESYKEYEAGVGWKLPKKECCEKCTARYIVTEKIGTQHRGSWCNNHSCECHVPRAHLPTDTGWHAAFWGLDYLFTSQEAAKAFLTFMDGVIADARADEAETCNEHIAAARREVVQEVLKILKEHWVFDEMQIHRHTWHDQQDAIRKIRTLLQAKLEGEKRKTANYSMKSRADDSVMSG